MIPQSLNPLLVPVSPWFLEWGIIDPSKFFTDSLTERYLERWFRTQPKSVTQGEGWRGDVATALYCLHACHCCSIRCETHRVKCTCVSMRHHAYTTAQSISVANINTLNRRLNNVPVRVWNNVPIDSFSRTD